MARTSYRNKSTLGKLWAFAPMILQVFNQLRRNKKATRGRYARTSKSDKLLDFLLNQAERKMSKRRRQ